MVWDGKAGYDGQTFVPHSEGGAHRLRECDVESVEVDGVQGIVERDGAVIVIQQDADAPEVGGWLDGDRSCINNSFIPELPLTTCVILD